jgi:hypothetical protein
MLRLTEEVLRSLMMEGMGFDRMWRILTPSGGELSLDDIVNSGGDLTENFCECTTDQSIVFPVSDIRRNPVVHSLVMGWECEPITLSIGMG